MKRMVFSTKTSILIQGPYKARVRTDGVYGGIFSSARISDNVPEIIQTSTKYLGPMEVAIYNYKTDTLSKE